MIGLSRELFLKLGVRGIIVRNSPWAAEKFGPPLVLSQDMTTISTYLQTWRLQLSHTKTGTTAFHLNNREAKRELNVYNKHFFEKGR